jgi:hypothetical protein
MIIDKTASAVLPGARRLFERACRPAPGKHTPQLHEEAFCLLKPQ